MTLTRAQKKNCEKLAKYLESLPESYGNFEMSEFNNIAESVSLEAAFDYAINNGGLDQHGCGTVACAIGHGPSAGVPFRKGKDTFYSHFRELDELDWDAYADRFAYGFTDEFDFMFGAHWTGIDNTHRGAAARIRFLLAGEFSKDLMDVHHMETVEEYQKYLIEGDDHIATKS